MMSSVSAWLFLTVVFTAQLSTHTAAGQCDPSGWFGEGCRYQCHCEGNAKCDGATGACPGGCHPGWFGPACQYVSSKFAATGTDSDLAWLTDNDPATCNNGNLHSVTVMLEAPQPLTWLRLVLNDPDQLDHFQRLHQQYIGIVGCPNAKSARVDDVTIDVACDTPDVVSHVTLTGSRLETLCSLYISGGRNVALKQDAKQPSTLNPWRAPKAVDGRLGLEGEEPSETCAHTNEKGRNPAWWALEFHRPVHVTQFQVFSRRDCCQDRLPGFRLDAFHKKSDTVNVFSHKDSTPSSRAKNSYTISPSPAIRQSVERVYIAKRRDADALTICEVMVFGDSACEGAKFGLECEGQCNCAAMSACFVSTGGCPAGCAPGFMGQDCSTACPRGTYGSGCVTACSEHCDGSTNDCDPRDGTCLTGCDPGYLPPQCNQECNMTRHGKRCDKVCSRNCLHRDCHHLTGKCKRCPPGFTGDMCDQDTAVAAARKGGEGETVSNTAVIATVVVIVVVCAAVTVVAVCLIVKRFKTPATRVPESQYDVAMGAIGPGPMCSRVTDISPQSLPQSPRPQKDEYLLPALPTREPPPESIYETTS